MALTWSKYLKLGSLFRIIIHNIIVRFSLQVARLLIKKFSFAFKEAKKKSIFCNDNEKLYKFSFHKQVSFSWACIQYFIIDLWFYNVLNVYFRFINHIIWFDLCKSRTTRFPRGIIAFVRRCVCVMDVVNSCVYVTPLKSVCVFQWN